MQQEEKEELELELEDSPEEDGTVQTPFEQQEPADAACGEVGGGGPRGEIERGGRDEGGAAASILKLTSALPPERILNLS